MAKTNKFILEYKKVLEGAQINFDSIKKLPKCTMKRFVRIFKDVEDSRVKGMISYPLEEIIVITFLAVLAGARGWIEIERFGQKYEKWLGKFLKLENGTPSHDTVERVFSLINSKQLEKATVQFLVENINNIKKSLGIESTSFELISVDGKEARGTGRKRGTDEELRNLQTLHVYNASYGICLFSEIIDKKTNEIPVAQNILKSMELKNSVVTFDAMNTQKKTCEIIIDQKGSYVGALKGNHGVLESEVRLFFSEKVKNRIKKSGKNYCATIEKAHNQIETREFYLTSRISWFEDLNNWKGLKSFICYEKTNQNLVTGKTTTETRFYIASFSDVELCAESIRGHWGIENQLHWHLDANFYEDANSSLDRNAFNNLSIINKMVLSLLKLSQPLFGKTSIRCLRREFGWDIQGSLTKVLNFFDDTDSLFKQISSKH